MVFGTGCMSFAFEKRGLAALDVLLGDVAMGEFVMKTFMTTTGAAIPL